MVDMPTIERPPAGLECDGAGRARPNRQHEHRHGRVEGIVAITGYPTGSGVGYAPGAIGRSLTRRTPKVTHGRSWLRPVGVVEEAKELPPGHPHIPATLANGRPWPSGGRGGVGAAAVHHRHRRGTRGLAAAQAAGPAEWMLGFHVNRDRHRGGLRVVDELDLYQLWPRSLDDDTGPAPEVKAAGVRLEVKAAGPARPRPTMRDRPGMPKVVACSVCRLPAAGVVPGGLRDGDALVCARCVAVMTEALDEHVATIDPAEVEAVFGEQELTSEQAYDQAVDDEVRWDVLADGTLTRATDDPSRGRAWGRS